jgi:hypothetical protein
MSERVFRIRFNRRFVPANGIGRISAFEREISEIHQCGRVARVVRQRALEIGASLVAHPFANPADATLIKTGSVGGFGIGLRPGLRSEAAEKMEHG